MSEHTPGPWKVARARRDSNFGGYAALVIGPNVARIAKVYGGNSDTRDVAEANGRLIANAPELLQAAKLALKEMCDTVAQRNSFTDAVDALDYAIDKAEGR